MVTHKVMNALKPAAAEDDAGSLKKSLARDLYFCSLSDQVAELKDEATAT